MKILFAAPENAWGNLLNMLRAELRDHHIDATESLETKTLKGYDVVIPTMCPVTASMIAKNSRLKLIQQCGAGLEGVDIEAAKSCNIWVANVPTDISGNADSVAELGIFLMIGLSRDVYNMAHSMATRKIGEPQGKTLKGRTVGMIGLGRIARALIKRLQPFDVGLIGIKRHDRDRAKNELGLDWVGGPDELTKMLVRSDYVVLCLPLTKESKCMISTEAFKHMKRDSYLINISRGGLVDKKALQDALSTGQIAGAGLDVFWEEPPDPTDPIFRYNVLATPHIGASTDSSLKGIVKGVAENIRRLEMGQEPLYHFNY